MKIKLEREGESSIAMEVELPAKLNLKGKTCVEFEKHLNIRVSGEGWAELELPIKVAANKIRLEGDVVIEIESEGVPAFKIKKVPHGETMKKVIEALEPGPERALSIFDLALKMGLEERQLRMPLGKLAKKQLIGVVGEKKDRMYYKLGVKTKDPNEVRSPEIPVIEK